MSADPLAMLRQMTSAETARRANAREANRARFPAFAEAADVLGGKLLWANDAQGEIGRRPALESHLFEVSAETLDELRRASAATLGRRK